MASESGSLLPLLRTVLAHRDVCSRATIYRRYDGVVRGCTAIPPGYADAGVLVPIPGAPLAVATGTRRQPALRQARSQARRRARGCRSDRERDGGRRDAGRPDRLSEFRRSDGARADGRVRCRGRGSGRSGAGARRSVRLGECFAVQPVVVRQPRRAVADRRLHRHDRRRRANDHAGVQSGRQHVGRARSALRSSRSADRGAARLPGLEPEHGVLQPPAGGIARGAARAGWFGCRRGAGHRDAGLCSRSTTIGFAGRAGSSTRRFRRGLVTSVRDISDGGAARGRRRDGVCRCGRREAVGFRFDR